MNKSTPANQLLTAFIEGYNQRNLPALLNLFTHDANVWGSGVDEYRQGLKELEAQFLRDWEQAEKGHIEIVSTVPTDDETWAAAVARVTLTIAGVEYTFDDFRTTLTAKKVAGAWKISHAHSSFPDVRNPENGSFPVT